ncbi:hypothetical protein [Nonomuraea ceibae]|uniref:hypothetical protein n=1 Tax=Nonomuraea ceibae TaxID=1935170 RepID=UPI001C5D1618|nr:hypothetical protein [Nonomuraea ceibae]
MEHTGIGTRTHRRVKAGHARALANYGPGWAIMWDDPNDQPVIVPTERGDDGTLLEICTYEDMFTLDGHCSTQEDARTCGACMPGGQPDFQAIAADMTDILGDYYLSRDDIAAYMPLTLPYTRALRAYGYQRHSQGSRYPADHTRAHDIYGQEYRSSEGHIVEVHVPLTPATDPAHGDAPAPPLTIRWIYLGRIAPGGMYPVTDLRADTPPADVAELIAAHVNTHPPTAAPDATTGGAGGPESTATSAPA